MKQIFINSSLTFLSALFIFGLAPFVGTATVLAAPIVPQTCTGPDCDFNDFVALIVSVVNFVVTLGIAFSAIVFAYAGWLYLTSGGDGAKISKAHEMFIKVLWGFLFSLGAFLLVKLLTTTLGLKGNVPITF